MLIVVLILMAVLAVSLVSEVHALGLWVFLIITHGFLVQLFGDFAQHLPMYAGVIIAIVTVARRKWTGIRTNTWLLMSSLLAIIALAAMLGIDPPKSIAHMTAYLKGFVLAVFIGGVLSGQSQVRTVTLYCVAAVFAGACLAFSQHLSGSYAVEASHIQRAGGLSGNPNDTAMLLLTGVPLALYWFTHSDRLTHKLAFACVIVFVIGAITLTQSRGGAVSLVLVLLLLWFRRPSIKALSIGVVFLCGGLLFTSAEYWERMQTLGSLSDSADTSLSQRYRYIEVGMNVFIENPILGVGMGNFGRALVEADSDFDDPRRVAHNMYLDFFVENGIFAGLLFITLLASALIHSLRFDKTNQLERSAYGLGYCISMSLVALMTAGLFMSLGRSAVLWFLVGIGLAFPKVTAFAKRASVLPGRAVTSH